MRKGFSLIEMLIYVTLVSVTASMVIGAVVILLHTNARLGLAKEVGNSAAVSLERMVREIRLGNQIITASSTFDSNPGVLVIRQNVNATTRTVIFQVVNNALQVTTDGVVEGNLTENGVTVSNLVFEHPTTTRSEGVRIEMTLQASNNQATTSKSFIAGAILRDSY